MLAVAAVHATLLKPVPVHASAGTKFAVSFTLRDAAGRPVDEKGVFVVAICTDGTVWTIALAKDAGNGRYRALATSPSGGLGRVRIGHGGTYYPVR